MHIINIAYKCCI